MQVGKSLSDSHVPGRKISVTSLARIHHQLVVCEQGGGRFPQAELRRRPFFTTEVSVRKVTAKKKRTLTGSVLAVEGSKHVLYFLMNMYVDTPGRGPFFS
jgi:hypothetical protein